MHHDATMRTTIDIPESLHSIALAVARHTGKSFSQAVAELIRRGLEAQPLDRMGETYSIHDKTGLPVVRSSRSITADDVKAVESEA